MKTPPSSLSLPQSVFEQPTKVWSKSIKTRTWEELRDIDFPFALKHEKQGAVQGWFKHACAHHLDRLVRDGDLVALTIDQVFKQNPWDKDKWGKVLKTIWNTSATKHLFDICNNIERTYNKPHIHVLASWMNTPHVVHWVGVSNLEAKATAINMFSRINHPVLKNITDILKTTNEQEKVLQEALERRLKGLENLCWRLSIISSSTAPSVGSSSVMFSQSMQDIAPEFCQHLTQAYCKKILYFGNFKPSLAQRLASKIKNKTNFIFGSVSPISDPIACVQSLDAFVSDNHKCIASNQWKTVEKTFKIILKSSPSVSQHAPMLEARLLKKDLVKAVEVPTHPTLKKKM